MNWTAYFSCTIKFQGIKKKKWKSQLVLNIFINCKFAVQVRWGLKKKIFTDVFICHVVYLKVPCQPSPFLGI